MVHRSAKQNDCAVRANAKNERPTGSIKTFHHSEGMVVPFEEKCVYKIGYKSFIKNPQKINLKHKMFWGNQVFKTPLVN